MMITKDSFLKKYNISKSDFIKSKVIWNDLIDTYIHYDKIKDQFDPTAKDVVERLIKLQKVHSVKYRIKESEHLIEKIIRKKIENSRGRITIDNFAEKITDIVGVRALHLFKNDWEEIHDFIKSTWDF